MNFLGSTMGQVFNAVLKSLAVLVPFSMMAIVFGASHYDQVFFAVIISLAINVMHDFILGYRSAKFIRHYENMFSNIAVFPGIRMLWNKQVNITTIALPTALPVWVAGTSPEAFWLPYSHSSADIMLHDGVSQT